MEDIESSAVAPAGRNMAAREDTLAGRIDHSSAEVGLALQGVHTVGCTGHNLKVVEVEVVSLDVHSSVRTGHSSAGEVAVADGKVEDLAEHKCFGAVGRWGVEQTE